MAFALIAEFPLGTYRAHQGSGEADLVPSPARLHAALLCAAAQGTRGLADDGEGLAPHAGDLDALTWLERHPPDGMAIPRTSPNSRAHLRYRRTGIIRTEGRDKAWMDKMAKDPPESSVAVSAPLAWTWREAPPRPVSLALESLAPDVAYVGTSEAPVRLRVGDVEPTHALDPDGSYWDAVGVPLAVPVDGRTEALRRQHRRVMMSPTGSADAHTGSDDVRRPAVVDDGTATALYTPLAQEDTTPLPWSSVILLALDRQIPDRMRVRWAVAVHRALIALIGDGAPGFITGVPPGGDAPGPRPANRLAIQFLSPRMPSAHVAGAATTLALLVPSETAADELEVLGGAVGQLRAVRGPGGALAKVTSRPRVVEARTFWHGDTEAHRWETVPVAVPDTRGVRGRWSLGDAIALSVALLWRDQLVGHGKGDRWQRAMADAAIARGLDVHEAGRVRGGDLGVWVHRTNPHAVVQPYWAVMDLGSLTGPRTLLAVGQSRHLGGGLLVPVNGEARHPEVGP